MNVVRALLGCCMLAVLGGCATTAPLDEEAESSASELQMRLPDRAAAGKDTAEAEPENSRTGLLAVEAGGVSYRLRVGDTVSISFRGIPRPFEIVEEVDENGFIKLEYVSRIHAVGLTSSELADVIHAAYVPDYYRQMTVSVFVASQSYFVRGEVRRPGRFPLTGTGMTLLQAIATSGGYTEYANPKRIEILRGGTTLRYDLTAIEKNPENDVAVTAGDVVIVRRSFF